MLNAKYGSYMGNWSLYFSSFHFSLVQFVPCKRGFSWRRSSRFERRLTATSTCKRNDGGVVGRHEHKRIVAQIARN